jgi:hypothetical protein
MKITQEAADRPSSPIWTVVAGSVFRRSLELGARLSEQTAGDDQLLDLLRPLEDAMILRPVLADVPMITEKAR